MAAPRLISSRFTSRARPWRSALDLEWISSQAPPSIGDASPRVHEPFCMCRIWLHRLDGLKSRSNPPSPTSTPSFDQHICHKNKKNTTTTTTTRVTTSSATNNNNYIRARLPSVRSATWFPRADHTHRCIFPICTQPTVGDRRNTSSQRWVAEDNGTRHVRTTIDAKGSVPAKVATEDQRAVRSR